MTTRDEGLRRVERAADEVDEAVLQREAAVAEALAAGYPASTVARAARLSVDRVERIAEDWAGVLREPAS